MYMDDMVDNFRSMLLRKLHVFQVKVSNRDQGLLRPSEEPINLSA
jgi:hypothetical protein